MKIKLRVSGHVSTLYLLWYFSYSSLKHDIYIYCVSFLCNLCFLYGCEGFFCDKKDIFCFGVIVRSKG